MLLLLFIVTTVTTTVTTTVIIVIIIIISNSIISVSMHSDVVDSESKMTFADLCSADSAQR